jgi:hypothetical protein
VSFPSPEDGNRSSFRNILIFSYLESGTVERIHKPSDSGLTDIYEELYMGGMIGRY